MKMKKKTKMMTQYLMDLACLTLIDQFVMTYFNAEQHSRARKEAGVADQRLKCQCLLNKVKIQ